MHNHKEKHLQSNKAEKKMDRSYLLNKWLEPRLVNWNFSTHNNAIDVLISRVLNQHFMFNINLSAAILWFCLIEHTFCNRMKGMDKQNKKCINAASFYYYTAASRQRHVCLRTCQRCAPVYNIPKKQTIECSLGGASNSAPLCKLSSENIFMIKQHNP